MFDLCLVVSKMTGARAGRPRKRLHTPWRSIQRLAGQGMKKLRLESELKLELTDKVTKNLELFEKLRHMSFSV